MNLCWIIAVVWWVGLCWGSVRADPGERERWSFATGGYVYSSPAVSSDGATVYVGSWDNKVYALAQACDTTLVGVYCMNGDTSAQCPLGTFGNVPGQTTESAACPNKCPSGKFGNRPGQSTEPAACQPCGAGTSAASPGQSQCQSCAGGQYATSPGQSQCQLCAAGKASPIIGAKVPARIITPRPSL